jgi:hypothetical protein
MLPMERKSERQSLAWAVLVETLFDRIRLSRRRCHDDLDHGQQQDKLRKICRSEASAIHMMQTFHRRVLSNVMHRGAVRNAG